MGSTGLHSQSCPFALSDAYAVYAVYAYVCCSVSLFPGQDEASVGCSGLLQQGCPGSQGGVGIGSTELHRLIWLHSLCSPMVQNEACSGWSQQQVLGFGVEQASGDSWLGQQHCSGIWSGGGA